AAFSLLRQKFSITAQTPSWHVALLSSDERSTSSGAQHRDRHHGPFLRHIQREKPQFEQRWARNPWKSESPSCSETTQNRPLHSRCLLPAANHPRCIRRTRH